MTVWDSSAASATRALVFRRGVDNHVAVPVVRHDLATGEESPADVTGWTITVSVLSPQGDVWLSWPALKDAGGVVLFGPDATQLADPVWRGRPLGQVQVVAVHDGETSMLVDANVRIV